MTEITTKRETAKIYQFPAKGRVPKSSHLSGGRKVVEMPARYATVECGSGWYHDAAIQDADQRHR